MSTELLVPLLGYLLLLAVGLVWIALDAETAYISDVFGKNFCYVWRQSGKRWRFTFMYGWRLLSLVMLIAACGYLSWRMTASSVDSWAGANLLFAILAPWEHMRQSPSRKQQASEPCDSA